MGSNRCDATSERDYTEGVAYAIAELSQIPDTTLYLDSGFGGWIGWSEGMRRVIPVYKKVLARARQMKASAKIRGFASNVANYSPLFASGCPAKEKCPLAKNPSTGEMNYDWNPCISEHLFTARLNAYLAAAGLPTRWIVDTSRSGRAGIRNRWGSWCNVKNAGIGERPVANPSNAPQVDALVWIKPPGESDGHSKLTSTTPPVDRECNPDDPLGVDALSDAPRAGRWFQAQFAMLVRNANPPMAAGTVPPCLFDPQLNPVCAEYDKYWEDVAVKYSPQFKFHPKETIWPITIDEYLTHVTGCVGSTFETGWEDQITYNQPVPVTPTNLDTLLSDGALKTEQGYTALVCAGEVDEETDWVKDSGRNPANGGTKVYTIIYDPKPDDKDSFVEIQYWMFNPYNYVFYDSLAGIYNHVTDLVAIAIRFTKTGQPQRIWYAQHGDGPVWAWDTGADWADSRAKNFATVLGTHPIVYVSQENHEHYPKAGDNFNCHMGVCDNTGNGGTTWAPFDSPQSAFEFVHVKSEMSATMPNADRAKLFQGRNKWMAFNGKIGGYVKGTHLHTGINSISFQKNQGKERQRLVQARRIEVMRQQSHVAGLEGRIQEGKEERERTRTALAGTMVTAALAGTSAHHA